MRQRRTIAHALKRKPAVPSRNMWKGGISALMISIGCWSLSRLSSIQQATLLEAQPPPTNMSPLLPSKYPEGTKGLIINIGSNKDPILPKDSCSISLAFEPMVPQKIPPHPQLHVIPAAVVPNETTPTVTMYDFFEHSVSSSLKPPAKEAWWNSKQHDHGTREVPAISLKQLVTQLPIPIRFIQTDIQGMDFEVVSSALDVLLKKVPLLRTEVWLEGIYTYANARNDFCQDWLPRMIRAGYELVEVRQYNAARAGYENQTQALKTCQQFMQDQKAGLKEADALWKWQRLSTPVTPEDFEYPKSFAAAANLSKLATTC